MPTDPATDDGTTEYSAEQLAQIYQVNTFGNPAHMRADVPCTWCGAQWFRADDGIMTLHHDQGCAYMYAEDVETEYGDVVS